jgi:hypothetical protein
VLHAQTAFLFSKVFALCRSEDRIRAISIKNGLVCGRAEVLANDKTSFSIRLVGQILVPFLACQVSRQAAAVLVHEIGRVQRVLDNLPFGSEGYGV